MSRIVTFYTPGTGLPDFEMRIALGLCAATLNVVEPEKVTLRVEDDRYAIDVDHHEANSKMRDSLSWFCTNSIGDSGKLNNISGFYGAIINPSMFKKSGTERFPGYAKMIARFAADIKKSDPNKLFSISPTNRKKLKDFFLKCGHTINFDIKMSAITPLSPEIGKLPLPFKNMPCRMAVKRDNLDVCPLCATLAILGSSIFQIHMIVPAKEKGRHIYSFLPHFVGSVSGNALSEFSASSKFIKQWQEKAMGISMSSMGIVLLSSYPHLVKLLSLYNVQLQGFFVTVAEQKDQAPRYVGKFEQDVEMDVRYSMFSPYNRALVSQIYDESRFVNYRGELLGLLARSLQNHDEKSALDFARCYVSATESKAMLPWSTAEFFAKEVCKMDKSLLGGEKFETILDFSKMLKFFVVRRNFGPVDNIRKASSIDEFMDIICNAQREVESIATLKENERNEHLKRLDVPPYLLFVPKPEKVQHLLQIATENEGKNLKFVKTLIALLAFTYYKREV